ncbi:unnamed protein product [Kuraishia capsulata CBS 1993]|uniref:Uncharacterized protein n=1 Tax=Kuraishia capsulata CBS 1993 TaxID=1382522 RepID=W6MNP9_9ASCO|nr:uncharacterized protein KUCA_T00004276001 [Kuraishia capsulata CBS 1993]CDK28294.1 unnamed protein product [Kuraishia capsulata CBS 1993]
MTSITQRVNTLNSVDLLLSKVDEGKNDADTLLDTLLLNNAAYDLYQVRKDVISQELKNKGLRPLEQLNSLSRSGASSSQKDRIHQLTKTVEDKLFEYDSRLKEHKEQYEQELRLKTQAEEFPTGQDTSVLHTVLEEEDDGEDSMTALRKRLLSTQRSSQLDTIEDKNKYHETLHEDYLKDISFFVGQAKSTALRFQQALSNDASILKEASEELEKSQGKLGKVGQLLSHYHRTGKLSIWFYIRLILALFIGFFICLLLIQILPRG